jgi:hypothetical protein
MQENRYAIGYQELFRLGLYYLWSEQNVGDMAASTEEVLMRIRDVHRETNLLRIRESSRYGYYKNILETGTQICLGI